MPTTHGQWRNPVYEVWKTMRQRCLNPKCQKYPSYGARGITVCARWGTFENFYKDMGDRPFAGATLERRDNDGPYCKSNCTWATAKVQNRNTTRTLVVTYKGTSQKLISLVDTKGLNYRRVYMRLYKCGWSVERAIDTP